MPAGEEGTTDETPTAARIDSSAPARAARSAQSPDTASAHSTDDTVAAIPPEVAFEDKTALEEGQIVPRFVLSSEKFDEPSAVSTLNITGAERCAVGATSVAADAPASDQVAGAPTYDVIPDEQQVVRGGVEEEKGVDPEIEDVVQPTVDAATYEMRPLATVGDADATAAPRGLYKVEEHPAETKSGEAVGIVAAVDIPPVEGLGGAKAAPDPSPMQELTAVESVVDDTTGAGNSSASAVSTSESDGPSTASTDDTNVEPASSDTTVRARKELSLIQKVFKKIFRKKGKRRRAWKKKAALKDKALAEGNRDDGETVGARAQGDEAFLVRIVRQPEADVETRANTKDEEDSSICDERKPAAIERPAVQVQGAVGVSTAMINQMGIIQFGPMDTE